MLYLVTSSFIILCTSMSKYRAPTMSKILDISLNLYQMAKKLRKTRFDQNFRFTILSKGYNLIVLIYVINSHYKVRFVAVCYDFLI